MCGLFSKLAKNPQELFGLGQRAEAEGDYEAALKYYQKSADKGGAQAWAALGKMYYKGVGGARDYGKAVECFTKASEQNEPQSEYILALCYRDGVGAKQNNGLFIDFLRRSAEHGYVRALHDLGVLHLEGYPGISKSVEKAGECFRQAAQGGYIPAKVKYGIYLSELAGDNCDPQKALQLFRSAEENGSVEAKAEIGIMHYTGRVVGANHAKAKDLVMPAYESGYVRAKAIVGMMYYSGDLMPKDQAKGVKLIEEAASAGMYLAMTMLIEIYGDSNGPYHKPDELMGLLRKVAASGNRVAQYRLGCILLQRAGGQNEAVSLITNSANQGYPEAEMKLGVMYCEGKLVQQNYTESARLLRSAGKHGVKAAYDYLDLMYNKKLIRPPDDEEWVRYSKSQAEKGEYWAMNNLGGAYRTGRGVKQDYGLAIQWFTKAVQGGNTSAMRSLGDMYLKGQGVAKDEKEGIRLYNMAIEKGDVDAMFNLALHYHRKGAYSEAFRLFNSAYNRGDTESAGMVGLLYLEGKGTDADTAKAVELLTFSAEKGHLPFIKKLAEVHLSSKYGCRDPSKAVKWYRLAADKGDVESMRVLGNLYFEGEVVPRNVTEGIGFLKKAADAGDFEACKRLGGIYTERNAPYNNVHLGIYYLKKAHEKGDMPSAYRIALSLIIENRDTEAISWLRIASDAGIPDASGTLARFYLNGTGTKRDLELSFKYYSRWKYDKSHSEYECFRTPMDPDTIELLELAGTLCQIKQKYSPPFFVRRTRTFEQTWTEKVKVGEQVHKQGWSDGYMYEISRTPIYEEREFSDTYQGSEDNTFDFNDLIIYAQQISREYSENGVAMIGYSVSGQGYKVAEFYKGKLVWSP